MTAVREYAELARFEARWILWSLRGWLRELWRDIPGPLPVKVIVMAVILACLAIPGPADEIGVILLVRGLAWLGRKRRERKD
jgi:hypothetical protein